MKVTKRKMPNSLKAKIIRHMITDGITSREAQSQPPRVMSGNHMRLIDTGKGLIAGIILPPV